MYIFFNKKINKKKCLNLSLVWIKSNLKKKTKTKKTKQKTLKTSLG